jgi:hypothetical protein
MESEIYFGLVEVKGKEKRDVFFFLIDSNNTYKVEYN